MRTPQAEGTSVRCVHMGGCGEKVVIERSTNLDNRKGNKRDEEKGGPTGNPVNGAKESGFHIISSLDAVSFFHQERSVLSQERPRESAKQLRQLVPAGCATMFPTKHPQLLQSIKKKKKSDFQTMVDQEKDKDTASLSSSCLGTSGN